MRLLAFLLVVGSASARSNGAVGAQAKSFRGCLMKKGDVDVDALLAATRSYCTLLSRFGKFVGPSVANVRGCVDKVAAGRQELCTSTRRKIRSVKELLKEECDIHGSGGVLQDPSAAIGLLWLRRGLEYWADVFEQEAALLGKSKKASKGAGQTLMAQMSAAYRRTLEKFHGWVSRRAFAMALKVTPDWSVVRTRAGLPTSDDVLRSELLALATASREVAERMRKIHVKLDLEDRRRSI